MATRAWPNATTTRFWACPGVLRRPKSRRRTAAWPENSIRTSIPATKPPRSASRRSRRPTTSSRTRRSAGPTTGSATPARGRFRPPDGAAGPVFRPEGSRGPGAGDRPSRGSTSSPATSATSSATSSAGRRSTGPEPGEDLRGQIEVPFRDAVLGGTATLTLRREKPCPTCGGTGRTGKTVCATCRGEGVVAESERVRIKIPEGTEDGGTIRIPGKGGPGVRGGPRRGSLRHRARPAAPVLRAPRQRHPRHRVRSRSRRRTPAPRSRCRRSTAS